MSNIFRNLPMPVSDGPGAPVDTSDMGVDRSIVMGGSFEGATITVEVSTDSGGTFWPLWVFDAPGKKVIPVAANAMRVNVSGRNGAPFSANCDVGASSGASQAVLLPMPVGDGPGAPVDVSSLGNFTTFIADGPFLGATISVEISEDGNDYSPCNASFSDRGGIRSRSVIANFMRAYVRGRGSSATPFAPVVAVCAIDDVDGEIDTGAPITVRGDTNAEGAGTEIAKAKHQHRLEHQVEDEGVLAGARPTMNFIGVGVGAVDDPGNDRVNVTVPGTPSDGTVVERSTFVSTPTATSGNTFVDGMSGANVTVPIDGTYWAIWEGEYKNSNANAVLQVGVSVNSVVAIVANSERCTQGNASDFGAFITTIKLGALVAGDLVRGLFRKVSGPQTVSLERRNLTIFKVQ